MKRRHNLAFTFIAISCGASLQAPLSPGQSLWEHLDRFMAEPDELLYPEEEVSVPLRLQTFMGQCEERLYPTGAPYIARTAAWEYAGRNAERTTLEKLITGTVTWDRHINLTQDLRVASGAQFTITGTVNFAPQTKLTIEPGAKVIVDGGILHNSCGHLWKGIEVLGNAALSQTPSTNQGFLILKNNAVVENAEVGVKLFGTDADGVEIPGTTGGIVQTSSGALLRDCQRDVWFKPYQNTMAGIEAPNRSKFHQTVFSSHDNGAGEAITSRMVVLDGVSGIVFHDCQLKCTGMIPENEPWHFPTGIWSDDSQFRVEQCDFSKLNTGIRAKDVLGVHPCFLRDNTFDCISRGATLLGIYNAEVTDNSFQIRKLDGSWSLDGGLTVYYPSGLYLSGCEGYEVEENTFAGTDAIGNVGLVVAGSLQLPNEFYRNHFKKLFVGSLMQGNNRTADGLGGLRFLCNLYGNEDGTDGCVFQRCRDQGQCGDRTLCGHYD